MGQSSVGDSGFSSVGVVVGAMVAEEAQKFASGCHKHGFWFLGWEHRVVQLKWLWLAVRTDGLGSLVLCSRSLLYPKTSGDLFETDTEECIRQAILETKHSLDVVLQETKEDY